MIEELTIADNNRITHIEPLTIDLRVILQDIRKMCKQLHANDIAEIEDHYKIEVQLVLPIVVHYKLFCLRQKLIVLRFIANSNKCSNKLEVQL